MKRKFWSVLIALVTLLPFALLYGFFSRQPEDIPLILSVREDEYRDAIVADPAIALSPDNRYVAALNNLGVQLYDRDESREKNLGAIKDHNERNQPIPSFVQFTPDSKRLIVGGSTTKFKGGSISIWDVASCQFIRTIARNQVYGPAVIFPNGRTLAYGGKDGKIVLVDIASSKGIGSIAPPANGEMVTMALSADEKWLGATYSYSSDPNTSGGLVLYDAAKRKILWRKNVKGKHKYEEFLGSSVAFSPDGKFLAYVGKPSGRNEQLILYRAGDGQQMRVIQRDVEPYADFRNVQIIDISPDSKLIAWGGRQLDIWNANDGSLRRQLDGTGPVKFSVDGNYLISRSTDIPERFMDMMGAGSTPMARRSITMWKSF